VLVDLGENDVRQNPPASLAGALDHRRGGLVAGRFDAEHNHPGSDPRAAPGFRCCAIRATLPWPAATGVALRGHRVQSSPPSSRRSAPLVIGTRGSPLALAQAREVRARLAAAHALAAERMELEVIRTSGDVIRDRPLAEAGGKGLFTKEIEEALIAGAIDLAVHSAKDMPTILPPGLVIAAVLPREDARDVFISNKAKTLAELPGGATVGTASLRRQALVKRLRGDLAVVPMRGNVETRLRKLAAGEVDAVVLALAGLKRLGLADAATAVIPVDDFLPAVGQGIIAIEARGDDERTLALLAAVNHADTAAALTAERAFLTVLEGSCRTPIAGHAVVAAGRLRFRGLIAKPDGSGVFETKRQGAAADAVRFGAEAGRELKQRAGADFFAPV
jgi:hydroxymethylbilane synthase